MPTGREGLGTDSGAASRSPRRLARQVRVLQRAIRAVDAAAEDAHEARKEADQLKRALSKQLALTIASPVFKGGLAGRTAIEHYANVNVGKFVEHMNTVGEWALANGREYADFFLGTVVYRDLVAIWAAAAPTPEEDERRALCEWKLKDPAARWQLSGTEQEHEKSRLRFIDEVLGSGIDTSVQELVRRSPETPQGRGGGLDEDEDPT